MHRMVGYCVYQMELARSMTTSVSSLEQRADEELALAVRTPR